MSEIMLVKFRPSVSGLKLHNHVKQIGKLSPFTDSEAGSGIQTQL